MICLKKPFLSNDWFGREGALFMRMNIATSNENVIEAIDKIKKAVPNNVY